MFKYKFFTVPAECDARLESELNAFLCGHSVVDVKQEYHAASGANGTWCFCIRWRDKPGGVGNVPTKGRTDYKEILEEADFTLYLRLRVLRKEVASREQVPALSAPQDVSRLARTGSRKLPAGPTFLRTLFTKCFHEKKQGFQ
jgi:hypothetical protein